MAGHASAIALGPNGIPRPSGFAQSEWDAVTGVLIAELNAVDHVHGLYTGMQELLGALKVEQEKALLDVVAALNAPNTDSTPTDFWLMAIEGAVFTAASIFPPHQGVQAALALTGALIGAAAGAPNQPPPPATFGDINIQIDALYQSLSDLHGAQIQRVLSDACLLPIAGRLAVGAWAWQPQDAQNFVSTVKNPTKIGFYQELLPAQYRVHEWVNNQFNYPDGGPRNAQFVGAPSHAYWAIPVGGQRYNVYIIHRLDDHTAGYSYPVDLSLYPSSAMMDDLFTQLQVPRVDFFTCTNGWDKTQLIRIAR